MKRLQAEQICDRFAWNNTPQEIEEGNFAHMSAGTLKTLLEANDRTLYPFNVEGTEIKGYKFLGLVIVVDDTLEDDYIWVLK